MRNTVPAALDLFIAFPLSLSLYICRYLYLSNPLLLLWARIPSPVADQQPKWRSAKRTHSMAELAIKVPEQLCNACRILGLKRHTAAPQDNPSLGVGQGTLLLRGSGFGFRILGLGFLHLLARATHHAHELLRLFGLFR